MDFNSAMVLGGSIRYHSLMLARTGLSATAARPGEAPKFIRVHTEARSEIRETTSGAPADAAKRQPIFDRCTHTEARKESPYPSFCAHAS